MQEDTIDIDTSGPGAEVTLDEPKETLVEESSTQEISDDKNKEEGVTFDNESNDTPEKPSEQPNVQASEEENTEQKKELEEYSDGVKRRIAKLTKKMREAERREEAATIYAKSVLAEKEQLNSRLTKLDTGFVSEKEGRIKSGMEAAVSKLAKAREENDLKAEVAASAEISRLGYEEARLADLKARQADQKADQALQIERQQQYQPVEEPRRVDSRARDWAQKNATWFNRDPIMTEGAKVIHRQLTEVEGYDPNADADEYYMEVDRRIRVEFPHKFDIVSDSTNKPTQTVASATRSSKTSGRKTVKLSPSQVAIARKLGVPLKDYAEQLKITEGV
jgi:hypothetical protein